MRRILQTLLIFGCIFLLGVNATDARAQDTAQEVGFAVRAVLPENQTNAGATYFDLQMEPEAQQTLSVEIYNTGTKEIRVRAQAVNASTSRKGEIDYQTPGIADQSLLHPFSSLVEIPEPEVTIAPGDMQVLEVFLTMPEELFDGIVLGGLVFTKEMDAKEALESSESSVSETLTIYNEYRYVIGVQLQETDTRVPFDFEMTDVSAALVNYQGTVSAFIRNKAPVIADNIDLQLAVWNEEETELLWEAEASQIRFAPNSVLQYPIYLERDQLVPGKYLMLVQIQREDEQWDFSWPFEISREEVSDIKDQIVGNPGWNTFIWILLIVIVILLSAIAALLFWVRLQKRREGQKKDDKGAKPS